MISMGPEVAASLVIFFKKEATGDQIYEFGRTVTGIPDKKGSGYWFLPGMASRVGVDINDYKGVAVVYTANATEEEKAFIEKRVSKSPIVYKIYKNVVPNDIKDL